MLDCVSIFTEFNDKVLPIIKDLSFHDVNVLYPNAP